MCLVYNHRYNQSFKYKTYFDKKKKVSHTVHITTSYTVAFKFPEPVTMYLSSIEMSQDKIDDVSDSC